MSFTQHRLKGYLTLSDPGISRDRHHSGNLTLSFGVILDDDYHNFQGLLVVINYFVRLPALTSPSEHVVEARAKPGRG